VESNQGEWGKGSPMLRGSTRGGRPHHEAKHVRFCHRHQIMIKKRSGCFTDLFLFHDGRNRTGGRGAQSNGTLSIRLEPIADDQIDNAAVALDVPVVPEACVIPDLKISPEGPRPEFKTDLQSRLADGKIPTENERYR